MRPNIGLRKRSRFYCITSSSILVSEIEYVLILLPHHTSKYPQIDLHRCCWNAIFTNVRTYLSYYVILWANKSKEHKFTGCSYLCFPTCHSVLGDVKTYSIFFWSICRAKPLYNLLHDHLLPSVVLYYQSSCKYISILGTADSKSPHRRLRFCCLSMVYSSGIDLRSQLSCKSMPELLSYLLSKTNLLDDYGSCSVNFTMHLLCADTTILLSSDVPFSRQGGS